MAGREWTLIAVLAFCGCASEAPAGDATSEVTDSAGVRVIRSADAGFDRAADAALSDPVFRVGWDDSGMLFDRLLAGRLRSGDLVVADEGAGRLYRFDFEGAVLDSIGRHGEGPGEFRGISGIAVLPGDSILVEDYVLRRSSVFGPVGRFARSLSRPEGRGTHRPTGTTGDGVVIWSVFSWPGQTEPFDGWLEFPVLASRTPHETRDTLGTFPLVEVLTVDGRPTYRPIPVTGMTAAAGRGFAHVMTDRAAVHWYDGESGEEYLRLSWAQPRVPLDDRWYDGFIEGRLALVEGGGGHGTQADGIRERLEAQRGLAPEFAPIVRGLFPASDGSVWLLEATPDFTSPERGFLVVPPDGECLTRVSAGNAFTFLDANERFVLGVERNDLDVQALVLYEAPGCAAG